MHQPGTLTMTGTPIFSSRGILSRDERLQADVRQADGVEHAGAGFDDADGLVAFARRFADGLGDEGAELGQVREIAVFIGVAAGARGGHHRVLQAQFAEGVRPGKAPRRKRQQQAERSSSCDLVSHERAFDTRRAG